MVPVRKHSLSGKYIDACSIAYPWATVGALASSGVVNAIYNYTAFDQQVAHAIGPQCADAIRRSTQEMEYNTASGGNHSYWTKRLFGAEQLADPDFYYMVADAAAMAVQYGHKDKLCTPMIHAVENKLCLIEAFANFTNDYYGKDFGKQCFYDTECLRHNASQWPQGRPWRWQKCSQLAFFQVAPATNSLRSKLVDLDYHVRQCESVFGPGLDPQASVDAIN